LDLTGLLAPFQAVLGDVLPGHRGSSNVPSPPPKSPTQRKQGEGRTAGSRTGDGRPGRAGREKSEPTATEQEILRAIDSGIVILRSLAAVARERNVVLYPRVEIFSDPERQHPIEDGWALILETTSPGGAVVERRIFPTTQSHFEVGKEVAWEWNGAKVWGAAWYRDPENGTLEPAWSSAAEFVGRHLDEI